MECKLEARGVPVCNGGPSLVGFNLTRPCSRAPVTQGSNADVQGRAAPSLRRESSRLSTSMGHARLHAKPPALTRAVLTSAPTAPVDTGPISDPRSRAKARKDRFSKLVELRSLYQDFMRAKALLRMQSPVYTPPEEPPAAASDAEGDPGAKETEQEEMERRKEAVEIVAEMQLTAEQIKLGLRALPAGFGALFPASTTSTPQESEQKVRDLAWQYITQLRERVAQEISHLPFPSPAAAQAALDARNARFFSSSRSTMSSDSGSSNSPPASRGSPSASRGTNSNGSAGSGSGGIMPQEAAQQLANSFEKLGQAERVAEQFVAERIKPVLRKAREGELVDMMKETGVYLKGLWIRLNGGGSRLIEPPLSPDLPLATTAGRDTELVVSQLSLELDGIEARLREAAQKREARLRKVRAPEGRATSMPFQLKMMDEEVLRLSRELAIRMLQLELEYVYATLEDEAVDVASSDVEDLLRRQSTTDELRLLAAEFTYLDEQLSELAAQLTPSGAAASHSHAPTASSSGSGAVAGTVGFHTQALVGAGGGTPPPGAMSNVVKVGGVPVSVEELLEALAMEVPDMRQRVGVADQVVFGGQGFTFTKARLQVREALDKLKEAITFLVRGVKLLGSDITNAARLFGRAAMGGTLKPREVTALRRTARDLLTFIPFTIILIIPLTPLGHVLVYGFIQQYFPSFFPSCFTGKRQEMMVRYEELERQLLLARIQAEQVEEEAELVKAAAAAAAATQPSAIISNGGSRRANGGSTSSRTGSTRDVGVQAGGAAGSGGGLGEGGARTAVGAGGAPDAWQSITSLDEAASVAVAAQTAQVKALEERIAAVYDDVTLGEDPGSSSSESTGTSKKNKGSKLNGASSTAKRR